MSDAAVSALIRLNAVYFLHELLSPRVHAAAVAAAANELTLACSADAVREPGSPVTLAYQHVGWHRRLGQVVQAQHLLETQSALGDDANGLQQAAAACLAQLRQSYERTIPVGARRLLTSWARCNSRPPRVDEVDAWAGFVGRRAAWPVLERALASGLRFDALADALVLAAVGRAASLRRDEAALRLAAAHAVRRLGELSGDPALDAWAAVADSLHGVASARSRHGGASAALAELALTSVRNGDYVAVQAVEAAAAELDALPAEQHENLLRALAAIASRTEPKETTPASAGLEE
jgi:hypothetical protein